MKKLFLLLTIVAFVLSGITTTQAQTRVKAKKAEETAKAVAGEVKKDVEEDGWKNGWKKGGEGIINTSLTSFSQWAEGGVNTVNLIGNLNLFADRKVGDWLWENDGRFTLGFTRTKNDGFVKGADVIDIDSKIGRKLSEKLYGSALFTFDSQFLEGVFLSDNRIKRVAGNTDTLTLVPGVDDFTGLEVGKDSLGRSKFLSPAVITFGAGVDYKPLDWISVYFSPLTFKGIIVNDQVIADSGVHGNRVDIENGVRIGRRFKPELGARLTVGAKRNITENLSAASTLDLYSNYLQNNFGEVKPQNIDVLWVTSLGLKVTKYIAANFEYTLKYDDEILVPKKVGDGTDAVYSGKGIQSKSFFGVGFTYKF